MNNSKWKQYFCFVYIQNCFWFDFYETVQVFQAFDLMISCFESKFCFTIIFYPYIIPNKHGKQKWKRERTEQKNDKNQKCVYNKWIQISGRISIEIGSVYFFLYSYIVVIQLTMQFDFFLLLFCYIFCFETFYFIFTQSLINVGDAIESILK